MKKDPNTARLLQEELPNAILFINERVEKLNIEENSQLTLGNIEERKRKISDSSTSTSSSLSDDFENTKRNIAWSEKVSLRRIPTRKEAKNYNSESEEEVQE